ncbi:TM2 domain-containing protein [Micromonospora sp. NPDC047548]|uniref:TM2 domain-containing protein n=1 Tax=Micromonospora sp. NPDC047548 TaxID=3155624 RepID=UPI003409EA96
MTAPVSVGTQKSWVVALLLCFFVGVLGVHRFYVGKVGTGILQLVTLGGLGIWTFIDFIMILVGAFRDKQGQPLAK